MKNQLNFLVQLMSNRFFEMSPNPIASNIIKGNYIQTTLMVFIAIEIPVASPQYVYMNRVVFNKI